jgi:hypothetical protein
MKISRSLFLALTGAMAGGSACHVYVGDKPRTPPPPRTYPYATTYTYATPRPAPPAKAVPPPPAGLTDGVDPALAQTYPPRSALRFRKARPVGFVTADPGYRPPPPAMAQFAPPGPSTESTGPASPAASHPFAPPTPPSPASEGCLDTEAVQVPDCSSVHVSASCPIRSFVVQRCEAYRANMDAKVATAAVTCMASMSNEQLCNGVGAYDCGKQALSEACADDGLAQMCDIAAKSCKTTTNDCAALLSGLNDSAKQEVARCIGRGCQAGLYSCVEGLSAATEGKR